MEENTTWAPSATIETLKKRAQIIDKIRLFFKTRNYLEVETPIMARFGVTDVYLNNIKAGFRGHNYALQSSPEYHMKRLLAANCGAIFQISRAFRDDELGRWHNPEFTMLEWYRLDCDHHELMAELEELLQEILCGLTLIKKTYTQVFDEICAIDPMRVSISTLKKTLQAFQLDNVLDKNEEDRDQYLFLLMSHVIEPALSNAKSPIAVYDFPASQASLSRVKNGVAERFEVYYKGIELANGFHELIDAKAQEERFIADNQQRKAKGLAEVLVDDYLLSALKAGIPPCSGLALGVDRLVALSLKKDNLKEVLAFDFSRA